MCSATVCAWQCSYRDEGYIVHLTSWLSAVTSRFTRFNLRKLSKAKLSKTDRTNTAEQLETRELLTVTASVVQSELIVSAGVGDSVAIRPGTGNPARVDVFGNGVRLTTLGNVPANSLTTIRITGGDGNNTIDLSAVTTTNFSPTVRLIVDGGNGNDTITSSTDIATSLLGGDGADTISGGTRNDTLDGGNGDDSLLGTSGDDVLRGGDGRDLLDGGLGNDSVDGGDGKDSVLGGIGNDTLNGGSDTDDVRGGVGNDVISGGSGNDTLLGEDGNDTVLGGSNDDSILGGTGNDSLGGESGNDTVLGEAGDDSIEGGTDRNSLLGGTGNDLITGGTGADTALGNDGNDSIYGGGGNDSLFGDGNTPTVVGNGNDLIKGNGGNDTLNGGGGRDTLRGDEGDDLVQSGDFNSDGTPVFSVSDANITEGDSGQQLMVFTVSLLRSLTFPVTVQYSTIEFTATAGQDFTSVAGFLPFAAGVTTQTFSVPVLGDTAVEQNEAFYVQLSNPSSGLIEDSLGLGTIVENQDNPTQLVFVDFDSQTAGADHIYTPTERSQILAGLTADYAAFFTTFTDVQPNSGTFTTLFINQPPTGGLAEEIDFRNLNLGLTATVDINGILGSPGAPATSQNFINLTTKVAAHELGHLMGLRHGDSFGPIGSGLAPSVPGFFYNPTYPGPSNATESVHHIMATPALGIETIIDALNDEWFGAREAVKLAMWAYRGQVLPEQAGAHGTVGTAQPATLAPLTVPNTELSGPFVGQVFDVDAIAVTGNISAGGQRDVYAITATAGQILNIEVMSDVLAGSPQPRFVNSIDSRVRVLDSNGTVIPYFTGVADNDDELESTDSIIIDLTIPSTGTYYIEVSAFGAADTGNYELFAYTFSAVAPPTLTPPTNAGINVNAMGDDLQGGIGNDTLAGADGQDTLAGGDGNDSLLGGANDDTLTTGSGNDTTDGGSGDDTINGERGNHTLSGGSDANTIILRPFANGTSTGGNSSLTTDGADTVIIEGNAGNNTFTVSQVGSQLRITTGTASITLADSVRTVNIVAGDGDDTITLTDVNRTLPVAITLDLGAGNDRFIGSNAKLGVVPLQVLGGAGNDTLDGTSGTDIFDGGDGNDVINGADGVDTLRGGIGDDTIGGGTGGDSLLGDDGADSLNGDDGNDIVLGGTGNDVLNGWFGNDTIKGENGNDTVFGAAGNDRIEGGTGADSVRGHAGFDLILGGDGNDTLRGDQDNDTINAGDGEDDVDGGDGNDLIAGANGNDTLLGGNGNDTLIGGDGNDLITGAAGNDTILAGDGDDTVAGNGGTNKVSGGDGTDVLSVNSPSEIDEAFVLDAAILALLTPV